MENIDNRRFLLLNNGQRLERPLDNQGIRISEFETYGAKVGGDSLDAINAAPARTRNTLALLREPTPLNRGELAWRVGMLLAAANFVLLALALSSVNPRAGRNSNYFFALFTFVLYYNMINLGQNWVTAGKYGMGSFMLALHGSAFLLGLLWLMKRHHNWTLLPTLHKRRPANTGHV